jgi:thiamine-phosphate diphosphorylase
MLEAARAIAPLARTAGAVLIVNDRIDVARAAGADGVHLGQEDLPVDAARRIGGDALWIGISTHDPEQARAAAAAGADYLGVGPMYATTSKANPLAPRGPELVRAVRALVDVPLVAIGGITVETAPALRAAGADAVAMIGALVRAPDVETAVRAVVQRLGDRQ